jgi:glycerophosphoryl diester phosphodiesterase
MIAPLVERHGLVLPPVIGHRGAAGRAPENTLAGFRKAKALGCSAVEFDVWLTADGGLILCHDPDLDRTTTGHGRISAQSLVAIRDADAGIRFDPAFAGERVPTLDEALLLAAELGLAANIEIKADRGRDYATAAAVADTLMRLHGHAGPVLVTSFLPHAVAALRVLAPEIPRGILFRHVPRNWAEVALRLGCVAIGADHRRLQARRVAAIREAGYPLLAFTVNNPARARLLFEWGVTSVFSDIPDIILRGSAQARLDRPEAYLARSAAVPGQGAIR